MQSWALLGAACLQAVAAYWMEDVQHQGISSFNSDPSAYKVFRNVKDFGAKGDGVTDDTAAINEAFTSGDRCGFDGTCWGGSTTTPATVYFPNGTYLISSSILDYYYTQIIGDPTAMPVIKGSANFTTSQGMSLIEANRYGPDGLSYKPVNVFFRQIRNLILDTTGMSPNTSAVAIHWPSSQATTIQNIVFRLSEVPGNKHTGIFMEEGSGGFLGDLVFYGGQYGAQLGNQQYTTQNLTFYNAQTAISQFWNWFWVYKGITVVNCEVGINITSSSVGSAVILDSTFHNTSVAIAANRSTTEPGEMPGQGSLVFDNVEFSDVDTMVVGLSNAVDLELSSESSTTISGKILGNVYTPNGPNFVYDGPNDWFTRPTALEGQDKYYRHSKPTYDDIPSTQFLSARSFGAKGDGVTDDTAALNLLFNSASQSYSSGAVAFVDAGYYKVTDTIYIPPNVRIVGEALTSVIMGSGEKFSDISSPVPVVQVGKPGESGYIEWSDMFVSTQGATAGAIAIEYNLAGCSDCENPSGMWDVHIRIGGFAGSQLQKEDCPTFRNSTKILDNCIAAYMGMHITKPASDLYMENTWMWVADHDLEDQNVTQVSVYGGRGLLIESEAGRIWNVASGVEHWVLYQYQLKNTQNVWMGQVQSETPYYQPNPPAPYPFTEVNEALSDPDFATDCAALAGNGGFISGSNITAPCGMAWGLRIIDSSNVVVYGAGHYSFFNNYDTTCSDGPFGATMKCQSRMVWIEDTTGSSENVAIYDLQTIGALSMLTHNGTDIALWKENWNTFGESLALFKAY